MQCSICSVDCGVVLCSGLVWSGTGRRSCRCRVYNLQIDFANLTTREADLTERAPDRMKRERERESRPNYCH